MVGPPIEVYNNFYLTPNQKDHARLRNYSRRPDRVDPHVNMEWGLNVFSVKILFPFIKETTRRRPSKALNYAILPNFLLSPPFFTNNHSPCSFFFFLTMGSHFILYLLLICFLTGMRMSQTLFLLLYMFLIGFLLEWVGYNVILVQRNGCMNVVFFLDFLLLRAFIWYFVLGKKWTYWL